MCQITEQLQAWMADRANNAIEPDSPLPAFAKPLVGFAAGDDKLFDFFKADIGAEFYWTPEEAFSLAFPRETVRADELSVIAWVLPQTDHNEWCLFHSTDKCLVCAKRCPAGAISKAGHDKVKCKEYIRNVTAVHVEQKQLGFKVNSCGLCQTKVLCEAKNPVLKTRRH